MLNDWSSAADIGELTSWIGTKGYSDEAEKPMHAPSAKSDLVAFVKTVFSILLGIDPGERYTDFWSKNMSLSFWKLLMKHAEDLDYVSLKDQVASL